MGFAKRKVPIPPGTCSKRMFYGSPCMRPIYHNSLCIMHCPDPEKDVAKFQDEIQRMLDNAEYDFSEFIFPLKADFSGRTFENTATFIGVQFTKGVDFSGARFEHEFSFSQGTVTDHANFDSVHFKEVADFSMAIFQSATFRAANFKDVYFTSATFTGYANFLMATFTGETYFANTAFGLREGVPAYSPLPVVANFTQVTFEQPTKVLFFQVNKKSTQPFQVHFVNSNIEGVRFEDVSWNCFGRRMVLEDELDVRKWRSGKQLPKPETSYELTCIAYRQLIINFERVRDYEHAEDCFIGMMEMRRLNPAASSFSRIVLALYRTASSYGSSYQRAASVTIVLFVLFWTAFLFAGIESASGNIIEWNILPDDIHRFTSIRAYLSDILQAFIFTLSIVTFRRTEVYKPIGIWSALWVNVFTTVFTTQLALLILALRRRLKM